MGASTSAKKFTCLHCIYCCYFGSLDETPTVFTWEKRMLEDLAEEYSVSLSFKPILVFSNNSDNTCIVALYKWVIQGFCPFYSVWERRCIIHYYKPLACRMYPLILDFSKGRILISRKCLWVSNVHPGKLINLQKVFPEELEAAIEAYAHIASIFDVAKELNLKTLNLELLNRCKQVIDFDEYITEK